MALGRDGEKLFAQLLRDQGVNVTDVSGNCLYWDKDIDFIIDNGAEQRTIEVKNDSRIYKTGNISSVAGAVLCRNVTGDGSPSQPVDQM